MLMSAQPGWYTQPDGSQRYWDGGSWTQHTRPGAVPPPSLPPPVGQHPAPAPVTGTPFYKNKVVIGIAAAVVLVAGFSAMKGGDSQPQSAAALVPQVTATATATATVTVESSASAPTASAEPTETASQEVTESDEADDSSPPETFKMPKLVGKNLQWAQDKLQALGSWVMDQEDASDLDRFQILDSNWKVCSQKPKAGKVIPIDTEVVLKSVKLDERCP